MVKEKKSLKLIFGILVIVFILSMWYVSAASSITVASNESNGSIWYKAGAVRTFNFTILPTLDTGTNLTQINFTMVGSTLSAPITNTTTITSLTSAWTCTAASTLVNCTGNGEIGFATNVTIQTTLPSVATQTNQTWTISILDNNIAFLSMEYGS